MCRYVWAEPVPSKKAYFIRVFLSERQFCQCHPPDTLVNRIVSVQITGVVIGTEGGSDHFGFVAQEIGSFKSLGFTAALTAGANLFELSLTTGDVNIREVL